MGLVRKKTGTAKSKARGPEAAASAGEKDRWPAPLRRGGEFILLPKVLVKRLGKLQIEPRHMWLLLALQVDRFGDRPPRYYWEELARQVGKSPNTVRKWGYELRKLGLLGIKPTRELNPGEERRPGYKNERNMFFLERFLARLEREQIVWEAERPARRRRRRRPE